MSSSALTLARPYARAAFESAVGSGTLAHWQQWLDFAAAVAEHSSVRGLIGSPKLDAQQLAELLLPEQPAPDANFRQFIATLIENRRVELLGGIATVFGELKREHERVLRVTVRAAVAVDPAQAAALEAALARRFQRQIELETVIDPSVIGGAVIDAGNVVIDGSVRGRLERLAQVLTA
jgi:F-type H+-transporting ATPase subunit delta